MGVEVLGAGAGEVNGHGDSFEAFVQANDSNARMLLNVAEGKKKNTPRPIYNPEHPDNAWPVMVYSADPVKPELVVGKSLVGVTDPRQRKQMEADNEAEYKKATTPLPNGLGYRDEPYAKPQIVVLDPAQEKLDLKRKNDELQGQITALTDLVNKALAAKADPPKQD
jgi:hypothetical protein